MSARALHRSSRSVSRSWAKCSSKLSSGWAWISWLASSSSGASRSTSAHTASFRSSTAAFCSVIGAPYRPPPPPTPPPSRHPSPGGTTGAECGVGPTIRAHTERCGPFGREMCVGPTLRARAVDVRRQTQTVMASGSTSRSRRWAVPRRLPSSVIGVGRSSSIVAVARCTMEMLG